MSRLSSWILASFLFALLSSPQGLGQQDFSSAPTHEVDGSFLNEWLVLGPVPFSNQDLDLLRDVGGESNVRPKEGDVVTTSEGVRVTWRRVRSRTDLVSMKQAIDTKDGYAAYAYCELSAPVSIESDLRVYSSEDVTVWLNGAEVGRVSITRELTMDFPPTVPLKISSGRNTCLLKFEQHMPELKLMVQALPPDRGVLKLRVRDESGNPVAGARVQLYDQGELLWRLRSDAAGLVHEPVYPLASRYDIQVSAGSRGAWLYDFSLDSSEPSEIDVTLRPSIQISGQVLAINGAPQNKIIVQAISQTPDVEPNSLSALSASRHRQTKAMLPLPPFSEAVLTDREGNFQFANLRNGNYRVRCLGPDGFVFSEGALGTARDGWLQVGSGRSYSGIQFKCPPVKKGIWKRIPVTVGLNESEITAIHRAPDGRLWVGAIASVQVFDGRSFHRYPPSGLAGIRVRAICTGADGTVWIGTNMGLSRIIDGKLEKFSMGQPFTTANTTALEVGADGVIWIGTVEGLLSYDGERLTTYTVKEGLPGNVITSLLMGDDGVLWIGTDNGIARFDGRGFVRMSPYQGFVYHYAKIHLQDKNGDIWFSGGRRRVHDGNDPIAIYRYDGEIFHRMGKENGMFVSQVYAMAESSDGDLWFASGTGLFQFNGETVLNHHVADGPDRGARLRDVLVDDDDVVWCSTEKGLVRFDPSSFIAYSAMDGLRKRDSINVTPAVYSAVLDEKGRRLMGTEWGGIYQLEENRINYIPLADGPSTPFVRGGVHRGEDEDVLFGTHHGIFRRAGEQAELLLDVRSVIAMKRDWEGNLWYGHGWFGNGLSRYDPVRNETALFMTASGLPSNNVWAIETGKDGSVWVGAEGGLMRYRDGAFENMSDTLGIGKGTTWNLFFDSDGTLWICTNHGLHRFDGTQVVSITSDSGLPDENIYSATKTGDGIIWMASANHGLIGYNGTAVSVVDRRDGLRGNSIFAVEPDEDGSLWLGFVGKGGGLGRYRPGTTPPSVSLVGLQVDEQQLSDTAHLPEIMIGKRVTVEYLEVDLKTHPEKRQFVYKVIEPGGDVLYSGLTEDRSFDWTPHRGGSYEFEVQAIDRDLNYSEPARLRFHAIVPWYANVRLLGSAGIGILGLICFSGITGWNYLKKRQEADRLREQMLRKETKARKDLEASNRSLEIANQAKSEFLANMSHEIRTPLNAVLGFAKILQRDQNVGPDDRRQYVDNIHRNGEHLLAVINEILDLSKIEAGQLDLIETDFDLVEVISGLAAMFEPRCRDKGLEWRLECDLGFGRIRQITEAKSLILHGDGVKLRQVLINILGNAVKFTDSGSVTLRLNRGRGHEVGTLRAQMREANALDSTEESENEERSSSAQWFTFEVEDTGPGISASAIESILEPFTQASDGKEKGGAGLGLAISNRQVELMGGNLDLVTDPGRGSRFFFSLQFAPAVGQKTAETVPKAAQTIRLPNDISVHALVADDVSENRDILSRFLKDLGVGVTEVEDGEQALKQIRNGGFNITFLDIRMPGLTGIEVVRTVVGEAVPNRAQLVAISASALAHERQMYADVGFDGFMPKPFQFEELVDCLESQLKLIFRRGGDPSLELASDRQAGGSGGVLIDWERLGTLVGERQESFEAFVRSYIEKTQGEIECLREALRAGQAREVEEIAHRCRGLNLNFGIQPMVPLMEELESIARAGDCSGGERILADLEEVFGRVEDALTERAGA